MVRGYAPLTHYSKPGQPELPYLELPTRGGGPPRGLHPREKWEYSYPIRTYCPEAHTPIWEHIEGSTHASRTLTVLERGDVMKRSYRPSLFAFWGGGIDEEVMQDSLRPKKKQRIVQEDTRRSQRTRAVNSYSNTTDGKTEAAGGAATSGGR